MSFWHDGSYNLLGHFIMGLPIGIVFPFVSGALSISWLFTVEAVVGSLMNQRFHFYRMTLLSTLLMFGLPCGGTWLDATFLESTWKFHGRHD